MGIVTSGNPRSGPLPNIADGWPTFAPPMLPGCALWLRADLGITLSSGNVSAWADQSGNLNSFTQGTGANRPPYVASGGANGCAYLNWNGANGNNLSLAATMVLAQPFTAFTVARCTSSDLSAASQYLYDTGSNQNIAGIIANTGTPVQMFDGAGPSCSVNPGAGADFIHCGYFNGASSYAILNGGPQVAGNIGTSGSGSTMTIGNYALLSTGWVGFIYEIVAYSRALLPGELSTVGRYMENRYGIVGAW